jgi:hypothetical protein
MMEDERATRHDLGDHDKDLVREYGIYVLTRKEEQELFIDMYYQDTYCHTLAN